MEGIEIEKRVFMVHGENTAVIEYQVRAFQDASDCWLELRPLIAFRDYHATTHHNQGINRSFEAAPGIASVTPYQGLPALFFGHNADALEESGNWYYDFEYVREQERGLDAHEDLFNPFVLRFALNAGTTATVIASLQPRTARDAAELREGEIRRREQVVSRGPSADPLVRQLTIAADQFIVERGELNSVIAGYHWFADWGRDTMIALPGLTLAAGRHHVARNILEAFADSVSQGMLPNRFPDAGETPEYNTVDATLWFFEAVRSYLHYSGDDDFVRDRLYAQLQDIVSWHRSGTRYGIRLDADGLLHCGEPGVQLTWMDAKIGDWVVTPRAGKPVEIQALWYNAISILADLAGRFHDSGTEAMLRGLAAQTLESFKRQFWNEGEGCLYDVVDGEHRDASIRPNQILR